jgi:starch phosphorylase
MKNNPDFRIYPHTYIFGGKSAPAYYLAKKTIELINAVAEVVNNDEETNKYLKVVFIENYDVSKAEIIIPAADLSEQISTAGKEASGTSNMKFMMNGAMTIGTLDGANVEIVDRVGFDNAVIFGLRSEEVSKLEKERTYFSRSIYEKDKDIKMVLDSLMDGTFKSSDMDGFRVIYEDLVYHNDTYLVLKDFKEYVKAQETAVNLYKDRNKWAKICITNIAKSGYFASDRTIEDYVANIWHLDKIKVN